MAVTFSEFDFEFLVLRSGDVTSEKFGDFAIAVSQRGKKYVAALIFNADHQVLLIKISSGAVRSGSPIVVTQDKIFAVIVILQCCKCGFINPAVCWFEENEHLIAPGLIKGPLLYQDGHALSRIV